MYSCGSDNARYDQTLDFPLGDASLHAISKRNYARRQTGNNHIDIFYSTPEHLHNFVICLVSWTGPNGESQSAVVWT